MRPFRIFCVVSLLSMMSVFAYGAEKSKHPLNLHPNNPYGRLTMKYVTPHVEWAKPYYKGKLKVLVLAPMWTQRETVELAERLSIDYTAWMSKDFFRAAEPPSDSIDKFFSGPPNLVYELLDRYLSEGKKYDVIILGKLNWEMLPSENRFELLKKVAGGTGLVYVNPPALGEELKAVFEKKPASDEGFISEGIPLKALPRFRKMEAHDLVKTSGFGKGRVVRLIYDEPKITEKTSVWSATHHSLTPSWVVTGPGIWPADEEPLVETFYYDYYQGLLAKAVLWAAKKEPEIGLERGKIASEIKWSDVPKEKISVKLTRGEGGPQKVSVRLVLRNTFGDIFEKEEEDVQFADDKAVADFQLVWLAGGRYFADFQALSASKAVNWASFSFKVTSDVQVEKIEIGKRLINAGDEVPVAVSFSRPLAENETLYTDLRDSLGRLIDEKKVAVEGSAASFSFGPLEPLTILHEVRARIVKNGRVVHELRKGFPVRMPDRWDDFSSIIWAGAKNEFITHMMLRKLHEDEADAIDMAMVGYLFRGGPERPEGSIPTEVDLGTYARDVAMANLMLLPYNYRFGVLSGDKNHVSQSYCMSDPKKFEEFEKGFATDTKIFGPYGPIGYTHGDESYLSNNPDVCWSPSCLSGFRNYLKKTYGNLESLNESWGSDWKSWDEILPSTFEEVKKSGNYPPWFDHKVYMSTVFADFYKNVGDVLRRYDPGVRTGFDGALGFSYPNSALDWWKLSKAIQVFQTYNTYYDSQMEVWRSFAPRESLRGMWFGSYGVWSSMPSIPEFSRYHIWHSLFQGLNSSWFWTMGNPGPWSGYAPDLTSLPYFEARTEALREVKAGIGKLLLSSKRQNDAVAIHWSQGSLIAESFFAEKPSDWSRALVNSQMYFIRVLEALNLQYEFVSYEEVEGDLLQKENFRLLLLPHSRVVSKKEAENIKKFVKAGGVVIADIVPGVFDGHGKKQEPGLLHELFPSEKEGTAASFGSGKAILLGDRGKITDRSWKALKPHCEAFNEILKKHTAVRPVVYAEPLDKNNPAVPPVEIARFDGGRIEYAGILRFYYYNDRDFSSYPFKIVFDSKGHIYDVRAKKYLGFKDEVKADISYKAHLLAISPYRVKDINLEVSPVKCRPGDRIKVSASVETDPGEKASKHGFRLRVFGLRDFGPGAKELKHYAQNLIAEEGSCETSVHFALNDMPGTYQISVEDVMSGVKSGRTVLLQKQEGAR